ncbi:hypothetical protein PPL_05365 [Heterostelium album PN500]|uniref:SWIM-type domain-containing protein n=1 Tax=Heterostelium pallidum (strain ATCC 26659 / Pp 5 / PN500) TaxID=670386 RepID=D3B9Z4_HETP5|nr:hypothetical protein PPL_05365 [Heterostelium album PN500]EFA81381.1 hypothetical protein PPL_05365 [Heterostelium album PN500]|eukprot:XP_020433499.1 hypothetical protein PPL_05365 [Heterostelium album PN500]
MVHTLKELTLRQCSDLGEGRKTLGDPKILKCGFTYVEARIRGTLGYYLVKISINKGQVVTDCTCPMGGDCKHVRETGKAMYYQLRTMNINRLTPQRKYKESLFKRSRDELIDLLMEKWREENDEEEEDDEEDEDDDEDEDEEDDEDSDFEDYQYYYNLEHEEEEEEERHKRKRHRY